MRAGVFAYGRYRWAGAMAVGPATIQIGFGVGLVRFGILADTRERRRLLTAMATGLGVSAAAARHRAARGSALAVAACLMSIGLDLRGRAA